MSTSQEAIEAAKSHFAEAIREGIAVLTTQCVDTVDVRLCLETDQPTNVALMGTQIWTRLVETPGTRDGKSCVEAARQLRRQELDSSLLSSSTGTSMSNLPSEFACSGDGSCLEYRPCEVSCQQVLHDHESKKKTTSGARGHHTVAESSLPGYQETELHKP